MTNTSTLLIDTSGEEARLVLLVGEKIVKERRWVNGPGVGKQLLVELEELLRTDRSKITDISRIAVVVAAQRKYSAVRAGVTVANMLSLAAGVELVELLGEEAVTPVEAARVAKLVSMARVRYG